MGLLRKRLNPARVIDAGLPLYSLQGKNKRRHRRIIIPTAFLVIISTILGFAILIYLPPALINDLNPYHLPSAAVATDELALSAAMAYLKNHPDGDFDGDGLTNEQEVEYGTNPYGVDSDGDGVTDYAELFITETNPRISDDAIIRYMKNLDAANGKQVNSPVKIHNVVLWPENYESRAKGGVVRTLDGYRFCSFTGWVQFPSGSHAYKIINGVHTPLRRNDSGYFYIDNPVTTVRVYDEPLEMKHRLSIFGQDIILEDGIAGRVLTYLLPSKGIGLLTSRQIADADTSKTDPAVSAFADIVLPDYFPLSDARFGRNYNKLSDLASIFDAINQGECAILSLYSAEHGEAFVLAYGYNSNGNIYVADINTGDALGAINYEERAGRFLDHTGEIQQYEWFLYEGCGFSSVEGHRIAIVGYVDSAGAHKDKFIDDVPESPVNKETSQDFTEKTQQEEKISDEKTEETSQSTQMDAESGIDATDAAFPDEIQKHQTPADPINAPALQQTDDKTHFTYLSDIPLSQELQEFTYLRCQETGLEYELVLAVMWRESRFQEGAVGFNTNGTRDSGLMQINDINKDWLRDDLGITDLMDPKQNIIAGTAIFAKHMERFGDENVALIAYGAGGAGAQRQLERGITTNASVQAALDQRDIYRDMKTASNI